MSIERQVIGALILQPDRYIDVSDLLTVETFSEIDARNIFVAFEHLYSKSAEIGLSVLDEQLKKNGTPLDIAMVINDLNSGWSFIEHCQLLKEREVRREQQKLALGLLEKCKDPKSDPFETNDQLMTDTERVVSLVDFGRKKSNTELIKEVTHKIKAASELHGMTGVLTGFTELDKVYGGRQNSDLIIKAARPAMGKTAQALCEARFMAIERDQKVAFFSLEMSASQLMQRLISVQTGIRLHDIRTGRMSDEQWQVYNEGTKALTSDNLTIIDDVYTLNAIRTRCRKMKMRNALDIVFIDYLQLINHTVAKGRNKENEVSEISRALKMLAKTLSVPVVCLCQLSRAVEVRGGTHNPKLSDLRDSGAIEQDADIVEFLFRPEYYSANKKDENGDDITHVAFISIAKHRNGACGDIELHFDHECTKFDNQKEPQPEPVRSIINYHEREIEDDAF